MVVRLVNRHCQLESGMLHWLNPFPFRFRVKEHVIREKSGCYTLYGNHICIRFVLSLILWLIRAFLLSGIVLPSACMTELLLDNFLMPFTPGKFLNFYITWLTVYFSEIFLSMLFGLLIGRYHICWRMSIECLPCHFFNFKTLNCFFHRNSIKLIPSKNFTFNLILCKLRYEHILYNYVCKICSLVTSRLGTVHSICAGGCLSFNLSKQCTNTFTVTLIYR